MINHTTIFSRAPGIVVRDTGNDYVLVPVTNNIADMKSVYTLNSTGAFIWNRLDGTKTVKDIAAEVEQEFDVDAATALKDALTFFHDMKEYLIVIE